MEQEVKKFLIEALDAISDIESEIQGIGFEDYRNDRSKMIRVVECFDTIMTSVRLVPLELRELHPDIPWYEIEDFRNMLTHDEFGIDEDAVWKAAKNKLRSIKKSFTSILDN